MAKRVFDVVFAILGALILSPFFFLLILAVKLSSKGSAFYKQQRVGRNGNDFLLMKFRTMYDGSDKKGLLTIGHKDNRVTPLGYFLRKYKLDELPQLFNVLKGDMSFVGPRPEVRKYVELYSEEQQKVLTVRPGITDKASIIFRNESELLAAQANPEQFYIEVVMPKKLEINLEYVKNVSVLSDIKLIFSTLLAILR